MSGENEIETVELSPETLADKALAQWLASVNRDIPLHLSRFFPRYRMTDRPPTPVDRVYRLADEARAYLSFVYTGNC